MCSGSEGVGGQVAFEREEVNEIGKNECLG